MQTPEAFIKEYLDKKHPILFQLTRNHGMQIDDVVMFMEAYHKATTPDLEEEFKTWCTDTKRSGGVLVGSSVREFLRHIKTKL